MFCKGPYNRRGMSTALVYCGTSEGFVIGADGRAFNKLTRQVESDSERKIFAFENQAVSVAFAWSGIVKARTPDFVFSLVEETNHILPQLNFNSIFAEEFNMRLRERLSVLRVDTTGEVAHGIFLTLWKGVPVGFAMSVFKNGRTWDCRVTEGGKPNGEVIIISGPDKDLGSATSLNQASDIIQTYLEDCVAHPTEEIGGHIHIGKLTPEGFNWIIPPKSQA